MLCPEGGVGWAGEVLGTWKQARLTKLPFLFTQKGAQGSWLHYCPPAMVMVRGGLGRPNNNVPEFQNPVWSDPLSLPHTR